jgi:hypothetical protein
VKKLQTTKNIELEAKVKPKQGQNKAKTRPKGQTGLKRGQKKGQDKQEKTN